jgi:hypothetical protein
MMTLASFVLFGVAAGAPDAGARFFERAADAPKVLSIPEGVAGSVSAHGREVGATTRCSACHSTTRWQEVTFNHEKTGSPLVGAHAIVSCTNCHPQSFSTPVPTRCSGCHRDVHAGELGARCDGCHDVENWRSRVDADAHRRTNFPLLGGHAALPCTECHFEARERRFSRSTVECGSCHQSDWQRTSGTAVDHSAWAFNVAECRQCHSAFRFVPARFPGHEGCFSISAGEHAGIDCRGCHTSLRAAATPGACDTRTAACTACHTHECSVAGGATPTDRKHADVPGYQCKDRKCYECHQSGASKR